MLSAQLDGEDDPADRPRVEEHLAGCAGCRAWLDRAALVNRLTQMGVAAPVPDLSAEILAALPAGEATAGGARRRAWRPDRARVTAGLFAALAAVGAVQLILGLAQVGAGTSGDHLHPGAGPTSGHLWHESTAWNVAVGAAYLVIALRRHRPAGLVPMLTAFVGMLLLLSINDLSGGRVDSARLVSHGFVIVGYLLVVSLSRIPAGTAQPPGARAVGGSGWRVRFDDEIDGDVAAPAALRLVPREHGPLTAREGSGVAVEGDHRRAA